MAANGPPDLLIELLVAAARTSGGEVGLLRTAQVADVLGRRRDWVTAHAGLLRGFQLPGSDEWRFSARGVAIGVFDLDDADPMLPEAPAEVTRAHNVGRLAYNTDKLIAYDHFLAGWCQRTRTFAGARPLVVYVASSPRHALRLLARASDVMTVGLGSTGHDPQTYQYLGRTHTAFTCIDWVLGGHAYALRMAPMPPRDGVPLIDAHAVALLPESWWPRLPTR